MAQERIEAGLRIDVDTLRGTQVGVPNLVELLAKHKIQATFFFSVGPDNMGRHLWRLLRPSFFLKMLRSNAGKLYGYDILLKGTFWPGPIIGQKAAQQIQLASIDHEIGLHAWDHHKEQSYQDKMSKDEIFQLLTRGKRALQDITGKEVECSAAPAWKGSEKLLKVKETLGFSYNSDCRGHSIFQPQFKSTTLTQPQIPTTLPTYDEIIGGDGITDENYNDYLLDLFRPDDLNVLTIHAEAEGIACLELFDSFLTNAKYRGVEFQKLSNLLEKDPVATTAKLFPTVISGREGWVAMQENTGAMN